MANKKDMIIVERETYEMNEKTFFTYFIKGNIRGKEVKIAVTPPDKNRNGYEVLDIVFGNEMKAELVAKPYEIKDDNGNVIKGNTFMVRSVDENGEVYECSIKPDRASDKALLNMLMR